MTNQSSDDAKRITAHHEAGHITLTLASKHLELTEIAAILKATEDRQAQAGNRLWDRENMQSDVREKSLERAAIGLGGAAGEDLFSELTEAQEGRKIVAHPESTSADLTFARSVVDYYDADFEELWATAKATLRAHVEIWREIAQFLIDADGRDTVSKAEIESLRSVKTLLAQKLT